MDDVESADDELRALLRHLDPARALPPLRADAVSRALGRARILAAESPGTRHPRRVGTTWGAAAAAVVLIAATGAGLGLARGNHGSPRPEAVPSPVPATSSATSVTRLTTVPAPVGSRCAVPTALLLQGQTLALDGTVTSLDGGEATLHPDHVYAGDPGDAVVVSAPGASRQLLVGAVHFEPGERVLLAASDGRLAVCGLSAPYSTKLADLYSEAFGR